MTNDIHSKEIKQTEEENRILRKLLTNKEIELEIGRELLKKVWDIQSKKDLVDNIYSKHKISKTKIIDMVGIVQSCYYRIPSLSKKGNKPSEFTYNESKGLVHQDAVVETIKAILSHDFIDCGHR